jgi:hypothetical protein
MKRALIPGLTILLAALGCVSPALAQSCSGCTGDSGTQICGCIGQKECACATSCSCASTTKVESQVSAVEAAAKTKGSKTLGTTSTTVTKTTNPAPVAADLREGGGIRQD